MLTSERPVRLAGTSTELLPDGDQLRAHFATIGAIVCRDLFDATMVARLNRLCDANGFALDERSTLGRRFIETPALASNAIMLMLRRAPLFRWLERVTGCAPISNVDGQIVETRLEPDNRLTWHDDAGANRRLAVTIALGPAPYEGGGFELRRRSDRHPLLNFKHDQIGTALIFAVGGDHEHRLLPLTQGGPRRVFAGWFVG